MKARFLKFVVFFSTVLLTTSSIKLNAFALLGPIQPWMVTNGVVYPDDIGGPMILGSEYRWNVPVLTYGFDKSFLNYFGTNGVAAVSNAIQILNNLPPASQIILTNYPFDSRRINYQAEASLLLDLKAQTLQLLLEHLGLAPPTRNIYVLRQWNPILDDYISHSGYNGKVLFEDEFNGTNLLNYIIPQNYDPQTLAPSPYVNQVLYTGVINSEITPNQFYIDSFSVDPLADTYRAVADNVLGEGVYCTGLTYDDVGGLAYLLATNNIHFETLLPNVFGVGTNVNTFVNGAWRPGIDKITFSPQPVDSVSGAFLSITNDYTDNYITNGHLQTQQVARIISQPDFIFSANDVSSSMVGVLGFQRTGTTNWLNNAIANGNTNGSGPGVIRPSVNIIFNKLGHSLISNNNNSNPYFNSDYSVFWGSFDGTTNPPIAYPIPQTGIIPMTVRLWLTSTKNISTNFTWQSSSLPGTIFVLQTSSNLVNWTSVFTLTNNSSSGTYFDYSINPSGFYRLIPQ